MRVDRLESAQSQLSSRKLYPDMYDRPVYGPAPDPRCQGSCPHPSTLTLVLRVFSSNHLIHAVMRQDVDNVP